MVNHDRLTLLLKLVQVRLLLLQQLLEVGDLDVLQVLILVLLLEHGEDIEGRRLLG